MRVLHVAEPTTGGVAVYLRRVVAQQEADGLEVHVLSPAPEAGLPGSARRWRLHRSDPRTWPGAQQALALALRQLRPDVVHLHSFVAGVAGRLPSSRPRRHTTVYQPHAWATDRFTGPASAAVRRWEVVASRRTDLLVTNCEDEIAHGRSWGIAIPAVPVGVPIDTTHFRPPEEQERAAARRAVGATRGMVLVVGRLGYQKAQEVLVGAWEREPVPDADLVLLGDGDPAPLARAAPTQWGRSVRHVPGTPDVRPWLWAADVVAVPSRYETVSLALAEAMAVGTPVVSTRFSGAVEALTTGGSPAGHVVAQGDLPGLLQACRDRVERSAAFDAERGNGPLRVRRAFTTEAVAGRLEAAYRSAVAGRRRS